MYYNGPENVENLTCNGINNANVMAFGQMEEAHQSADSVTGDMINKKNNKSSILVLSDTTPQEFTVECYNSAASEKWVPENLLGTVTIDLSK